MALEAAPSTTSTKKKGKPKPLTMQLVLRRDLLNPEFRAQGWGVGPLMAQAAHAAAAVLHETRELPDTISYLEELSTMRKVVFETRDEPSLTRFATSLSELGIPHHLWVEKPENIPTCVAVAPNRKDDRVTKALSKNCCELWKSG